MLRRILLSYLLILGFAASFQPVNANINGKVVNKAGKPIANAVCSLLVKGTKATTGIDGSFTLVTTGVSKLPSLRPQKTTITFQQDFINFSVANPSRVEVNIFDVTGHLLKKEVIRNAQPGFYCFNIAENCGATKVLVIIASINNYKVSFRYVPLKDGKYTVNSFREMPVQGEGREAQIVKVIDSLKVSAANYLTQTVAITSYDTTLNITLDSLDESRVTVRLDQEKQTIVGFGINATIMPQGKTLPWKKLFTLDTTDALGLSILRIG
ncbi:MAG: carboxypeptidase-like regulatory domain-containing protein, partial [Chitinispirillaceae bacterium]|nr:carboxypeptidase-like regulatory domain-containing protein [Chitinispirillaceae bacterium]